MFAKEKLYLTAERTTLVKAGDPRAAFLYCAPGDEIPQSAAEKFGLVDGRLKPGKGNAAETLLGSSVLPAMVEIGPGKTVQLGKVVVRAHKESGLDVDAWNGLPEADREARLAAIVEAMKTEAAKPAPARPARTRKSRTSKTAKEQKPAEDKENKPAQDKEPKAPETKDGASGEQPAA